jgi:hypothetical protein
MFSCESRHLLEVAQALTLRFSENCTVAGEVSISLTPSTLPVTSAALKLACAVLLVILSLTRTQNYLNS